MKCRASFLKLVNFVQRLALIFGLGEMLFFAFIFAPRVFKVLPVEEAARLQAALFPAYYSVGAGCCIMMLLGLLCQRLAKGSDATQAWRQPLLAGLLAFSCGIFLYSLLVLTPQLVTTHNLHDPAFQALHRLSVQLNGGAMLALLVVAAVL